MSDIKLIGDGIRETYLKHLFLVYIDNWWAGFQKCSELSKEFADIDYWEGGSSIPYKFPGRITIADVTLERGSCMSYEFYNWANLTGNASIARNRGVTRGAGTAESGYRKTVTILQLDATANENAPIAKWVLRKAYSKKFVAGAWDNTVDEANVESLTLRFDTFDRLPVGVGGA